jgi:hypothetical protein
MASEKEEAATKEALTKVNDSQSKAAATDETDSSKAELLDDEGDLSSAFTKALEEVFLRFSKSAQDHVKSKSSDSTFRGVEKHVILTDAELDDFTKAVNGGEVLDATSKEEMKEYLDVDTDGNLTVSTTPRDLPNRVDVEFSR